MPPKKAKNASPSASQDQVVPSISPPASRSAPPPQIPHALDTHPELIGALPNLASKILKSLRLTPSLSRRTTLAQDNEGTLNALLKYLGEKANDLTNYTDTLSIPTATLHNDITFNGVQRLYAHPQGRFLFAAHGRALRAWSLPTLQEVAMAPPANIDEDIPLDFVFSPDGNLLALAYSSEVVLYDVSAANTSPTIRHRLNDLGFSIRAVIFRPDSRVLAVAVYAAYQYSIRVWNLMPPRGQEPRIVAMLHQPGHSINTMAYSPTGQFLASGGNDRTVCVWNGVLTNPNPDNPEAIDIPQPLRFFAHSPILWITEIRYEAEKLRVITSGGSFHDWPLDAEGLPVHPPTDAYILCNYPVFSPTAPVMAVARGSFVQLRSSRSEDLNDPGNESVHTLPNQHDTFFTDMVFYKERMFVGKTDKNIYIFVKHANGHWVPKPFLRFPTVGADKMAVETHTGMLYFITGVKEKDNDTIKQTLHSFSLNKLYVYLFGAQAGGRRARKASQKKK